MELVKWMDSELPFYYYASSHQRHYEGEMPGFSEVPRQPKKIQHAPRRELMGNTGRRVSFTSAWKCVSTCRVPQFSCKLAPSP